MSLPTVTRATLGTRALQRANLEYSNFISQAELNQLVDTSMAKIHNFMVGLFEDYYVKRCNITTAPNVQYYQLPPDFMKTRQVFYTDLTGYQYPMPMLNIYDLANYQPQSTDTGYPAGYVIENNELVIYPKPYITAPATTLTLWYIPQYTPPVNDNDQIPRQVAFGWDEWVINDVAVQIRNKAMMPTEELVRERQIIESKMIHEAKTRNVGDAPRVKDTGFGARLSRWNRSQFAFKR